MGKSDIVVLKKPEQIEALGSPAKREIVQFVATTGPTSVPEIADGVGRKVTSLYRHVHELVEMGLLLEAGKAKTIRRDKQLYVTPGKRLQVNVEAADRKAISALCRAMNQHLRAVGREMTRVHKSHTGRHRGTAPNVKFVGDKGWASRDKISKINKHLADASSCLSSVPKSNRDELINLSAAVWPAELPDE